MAFSGALTLTDLNDFITPSQACIKPVEQVKTNEDARDPGGASTEIQIDSSGSYYEVRSDGLSKNKANGTGGKKLEQAQISLNDCLACSGCITSAESVLITLQSHTEVLNFLQSNSDVSLPTHKVPVLSIAPQSLASLAAALSSSSNSPITLNCVYRRVQAFCSQVLGFEHVYDITFARHIALLEHAQEFQERRKGEGKLPMLASACPGWICYAEKAHAEMLPFIARTKSPQQVMGTLVKEWLGKKWGKKPDQIYHVSVMPCYDKKLEASRQDFRNEIYSTRDVDCVITTGELELMMREKGWDLSLPIASEIDPSIPPKAAGPDFPELMSHPGTSSGSYLQSLIDMLSSTSEEELELSVRTVRSSDYEEYTLKKRGSGEVVFRGAKCYGFRNLQNVVRKVGRQAGLQVGTGAAGKMDGGLRARIKRRGKDGDDEKEGYDYVEVMACPGGCVNGGGQLKPPAVDAEGYKRNWEASGVDVPTASGNGGVEGIVGQNAKWGNKEWTMRVEKAYWHDLPTPPPSPKLGPVNRDPTAGYLAAQILMDLCHPKVPIVDARWDTIMDEEAESLRQSLFRTQYKAVESDAVGLAVKW